MEVQMFLCTFLILVPLFSNAMFGINLASVSGQCVQNQKDLLLELKSNLTYSPTFSTKLVQWNESIDCCQWGGVKCDPRGRVTGLDLSNEDISAGIDDIATTLLKLEFLQSLNLAHNNFRSIQPPGFGRLAGLNYLNLSYSHFYGQVPPEFSSLTRLVVLDLSSHNEFYAKDLEIPDLKALIHNFTQLQELYLDGVNISANGYQWCNDVSSSLPNLRVLSLANTYITGPFDSSLVKLQSLSVINLDNNDISSPIPDFFADFPSLRVFSLYSCNLSGLAPERLFQITSLQTIDLSQNEYLEGSLPEFPLNASLQNLLLADTKFSGNVHESICNLKMLSQIHLNNCRFSGSIPKSIGNLTQLTELDLSINQFTGHVPSFGLLKNLTNINLRGNGLTGTISDSHWEGLENLLSLDLSRNFLEGEIPASLFVLPSLYSINLNNNRFYGFARELKKVSSHSLEVLDLSGNNLEGPIPQFLFELHSLAKLLVSRNKFNGSMNQFRKLSNLVFLDLSYNENVSMLSLPPLLSILVLASCNLQEFPPFLNINTSLVRLDLSDNKLHGEIPNWIWELGNGSLKSLSLSHNHFTSMQEPYHFGSLYFIDLHSNMLSGRIPHPSSLASYMDFSSNNFSSSIPENIANSMETCIFFSIANNNISGTIPPSLCKASQIEFLDLSNNNLHGRIPPCLVRETEKVVLNLRRNNLTGDIPDMFQDTCRLETLDLSWNGLQGQVPISLTRCSKIKVLNLGHNNLNDTFPCSFSNLSELHVFELRSNNFHGNISCMWEENHTWPNLQIINLASNNFNGVLSENLFRNMRALMVNVNGTQSQLDYLHSNTHFLDAAEYQDSITVTFKGQDFDLVKILTIYTSVDLSNNHFEGEIPQTIGELKSLYVLNLSHNALSGHIPSSVEKMQTLGSLDLSFNHLSGEIPPQLASLTFLSVLNLSYNELIGRIPQGNQMTTFPGSSFQGNNGLCGSQLNINCSPEVQQRESGEEHESADNTGMYISAELGIIVGLGVIYMPLLFSRRWRRYFNKHLNNFLLFVLRRSPSDTQTGRRRLLFFIL